MMQKFVYVVMKNMGTYTHYRFLTKLFKSVYGILFAVASSKKLKLYCTEQQLIKNKMVLIFSYLILKPCQIITSVFKKPPL